MIEVVQYEENEDKILTGFISGETLRSLNDPEVIYKGSSPI